MDGELEPGLRSIAAPVVGKDGRVAAAINISMSATRDSAEWMLEQHLPLVLATAHAIESEIRLL